MFLQQSADINVYTHSMNFKGLKQKINSKGNKTSGQIVCEKEKTILCSTWTTPRQQRQNTDQSDHYPDQGWWKAPWLHFKCSKLTNSEVGFNPDLSCSIMEATWKVKFQNFSKMTEWRIFLKKTVLAVLPFPTIIWQFAFSLFYFFSFGCSRTSEVSLQDVHFEAALVLHSHWSNGPYGCHVIWHLSWQASKRGN